MAENQDRSVTKLGPILADEILRFLPHRFPMILIDRVLSIETVGSLETLDMSDKAGTKVHAVKMISQSDPIFQGHFPGRPIFPGVMTLETLAQTACFSVYASVAAQSKRPNLQVALVGFEEVRFRAPITPGDMLELRTNVARVRRGLFSFAATAHVGEKLVAEGNLLAHIEFLKEGT